MSETPVPDNSFQAIHDLPSAPIIFFEFCPTLGNNNGLINIMLAAGIVLPTASTATNVVPVAVAHLRCSSIAAKQLRDALDKALLMGQLVDNPQGKSN
ncbi:MULTISPECIES: hypothetical protein [Rhodopseudomonas]|uniref:Uncharacterized protein n=1 Tax=Rhodopseudomonas palustris TaxID=1076 RepID=A0A0D7ELP7_RHOPL|nr:MULTISPECIES: hypothetical protein [Rhodopseudomonas]KIZ41591.1 hypothetical protein OO17_14705 [Rhodopseudomonas palustris]MDF3810365.1 hypothetical protein [Rhodopseudomonas sp. BAL398]WOK19986.1 hypothetical protein RBJ75_10925 [Rhodopseudomonas sp. BAL398]